MSHRKEKDSLGEVLVPKDAYYGAQTTRSLENFSIGKEKIPLELIYALALVKKAAALANKQLGLLSIEKADIISLVADEILEGKHDNHFPLSVWQTGSGTHTNMNVNEVISHRGEEIVKGEKGKNWLHPNDDVNLSQSSNDVFPTAMHIAALNSIQKNLLPSLQRLKEALRKKAKEFSSIIKVGRTHLMDAAPLSLGQEFSGYESQIEHGIQAIQNTLPHLSEIALGGTAVGTGLNTSSGYDQLVAKILSDLTGISFVSAPNKFEALASSDTVAEVSGALSRVAISFMKIAGDIRLMGSGPRCGLGELILPVNEPGSSIMPGKVNPTQTEAVSMVSVQVLGNDTSIKMAASLGNFELNVYRPMLIYNLLQSIYLLADAATNFRLRCIEGIKPHRENIQKHVENSLMNATVLNQAIGYDQATKIVQKAHQEKMTLKESAVSLGILSEKEFDSLVKPEEMISPKRLSSN